MQIGAQTAGDLTRGQGKILESSPGLWPSPTGATSMWDAPKHSAGN